MSEFTPTWETLKGEYLKTTMEFALHALAKHRYGEKLIETYAFGPEGRIDDPRLHTTVAGLEFENPIAVGAGWDKKGWDVRGLYRLGFSAEETGTVPMFGQVGNKRPRIWTLTSRHDVGRNALGFNSIGSEGVDRNLDDQRPFPCHIGINVGKNKLMPEERSPWAHAEVVRLLYRHASYFVFNPSSPNTQDLRNLQRRDPLKAHIYEMKEAMEECGGQKPIFVKLAPDLTPPQFSESIDAAVEAEASGLILANTTISEKIKRLYGVEGLPGGISGNDVLYRCIIVRMIYEAYQQAGDKLEIIGVGGVSKAEHVLEYMLAGASLVQIVTAIRPSWGKAAARINSELVQWMNDRKVTSITELIGAATERGPRYPKAA